MRIYSHMATDETDDGWEHVPRTRADAQVRGYDIQKTKSQGPTLRRIEVDCRSDLLDGEVGSEGLCAALLAEYAAHVGQTPVMEQLTTKDERQAFIDGPHPMRFGYDHNKSYFYVIYRNTDPFGEHVATEFTNRFRER